MAGASDAHRPRVPPFVARWAARAGAALFVVSVPVALIGANVRFLFGEERVYTFAVNRYGAAAIPDIPKDELLRAGRELRDYLVGPDEFLRIDVTDTSGNTGPLFSPREVAHMRDVRRLTQRIFRAQEAAVVVFLAYPALRILTERRQGAIAVARLTWLTSLGFNLAGIAFGVSAALGFDRLFTQFHELSFSNDFWLLDPERDHLVQLFPTPFWELTAGALIVMTVVESALLAAGARWYLARAERFEAAPATFPPETAESPAPTAK